MSNKMDWIIKCGRLGYMTRKPSESFTKDPQQTHGFAYKKDAKQYLDDRIKQQPTLAIIHRPYLLRREDGLSMQKDD